MADVASLQLEDNTLVEVSNRYRRQRRAAQSLSPSWNRDRTK